MGLWDSCCAVGGQCRNKLIESNGIAIATVYAILLLDNMLLTAVVPVLPEYLDKEDEQKLFQIHQTTKKIKIAQNTSTVLTLTSTVNNSNQTDNNCNQSSSTQYLIKENLYIGVLFASKPLVQGFANLAVGSIVDRIGFRVPILFGNLIMCLSALLFSFGKKYVVLLIARTIQGLGSASASVAGLAMLADRYSLNEDEKRGQAIGIAFGGLAMGVLIGAPFASAIYQLSGKETVFIILAIAAFVLAGFLLLVYGLVIEKRSMIIDPIPITTLLSDPFILLTAFTLVLGNFGIGVIEASQPLWMIQKMCSKKWELGVAFLPISVSYLIAVNVCALFFQTLPRWLIAMIGLYLIGIGCALLPLATKLAEMILPGSVHGIGIGFVDATVFPLMAFLVDTRHRSVYGSVYAIADLSFCTAFVLGPLYAGCGIGALGFNWLLRGFSILLFLLAPLLIFLRKVSTVPSEETKPILQQVNYKIDDIYSGESNGSMVEQEDEHCHH